MAKDPALLWYPGDYISGTMGMTFEEKGAYMDLLMMQFNRGHMTSHMIGHVLGHNSQHIWETIKHKFKTDDDGNFYNERLDIEKNKRKSYTESRRKNIKGINQYSKKKEKIGHMTSHMEDINENKNLNKDESVKKKAQKLEIIFPYESERFLKIWEHWKNYKAKDHKFKYKSYESEQAALSKLANMASSEEQAIKIITQSIENGWKGFFELKQINANPKSKQNGASGFAAQYAYDISNKENPNQKQ